MYEVVKAALGVVISLSVIAICFVAMRVTTSLRAASKLWLDDCMTQAATLLKLD